MNLFSLPMPFDKSAIRELARINEGLTKSRIQFMYNTLPRNAETSGFEQSRVVDRRINRIEDMVPLIREVHKKGMRFIYLINSPKTAQFDESRLRHIVHVLGCEGVSDFRVCSPFIIDLLTNEFPWVTIRCSTSQEYFSVKQYRALFSIYPNISEVVPSWEMNRNFVMLSNLAKMGKDVEIMVNEGCLSGCPFRTYHSMFDPEKDGGGTFFRKGCGGIFFSNFWTSICMSNVVYPWQIEDYNEIGIYSFKLVGRNTPMFKDGRYFEFYYKYIKGIEDMSVIEDMPISMFSNYFMGHKALKDVKVRDVKDLLPQIGYFKKKDVNCSAKCGFECRYCFGLAEKLQTLFPIQ